MLDQHFKTIWEHQIGWLQSEGGWIAALYQNPNNAVSIMICLLENKMLTFSLKDITDVVMIQYQHADFDMGVYSVSWQSFV
jgi:hypothetical protein